MVSGPSTGLDKRLESIREKSNAMRFSVGSDDATGRVLRTLAATRSRGRFLELGTGTGIGTAWLLDGMCEDSKLETVDNDAGVQAVARRHLENDARVTFHLGDATCFLSKAYRRSFDFVFADAWPGKFSDLDFALDLVKTGGVYFVDDLLPQPGWPKSHAEKVPPLIWTLEHQKEFLSAKLDCATGLILLVRMLA